MGRRSFNRWYSCDYTGGSGDHIVRSNTQKYTKYATDTLTTLDPETGDACEEFKV